MRSNGFNVIFQGEERMESSYIQSGLIDRQNEKSTLEPLEILYVWNCSFPLRLEMEMDTMLPLHGDELVS